MMDVGGMSVITVRKPELLSVLKENMAKHREIFLDARLGYQQELIERLESMLLQAKADGGKLKTSLDDLIEPMDRTKDYVRVIRMLEMHVGEEMKVTEHEFAQYVQDEWSWKGQFTSSTQGYVGKAGRR